MSLKNSILFFVLMLFAVSSSFATDFTGVWVLDESKLEDNGGPQMAAGKIEVTQNDTTMSTDRFMSNPMMGDFTVSETMTLDGELNESDTEFGKRKTIATWSDDKKSLTINSTILMNWDGQEMEMKGNEVWSMQDKDQVLKMEFVRTSSMGELKGTVYYNKQ